MPAATSSLLAIAPSCVSTDVLDVCLVDVERRSVARGHVRRALIGCLVEQLPVRERVVSDEGVRRYLEGRGMPPLCVVDDDETNAVELCAVVLHEWKVTVRDFVTEDLPEVEEWYGWIRWDEITASA